MVLERSSKSARRTHAASPKAAALRRRWATGVVIGAGVVAGVFLLQPLGVAVVTGVVGLAAGWEWTRLAGMEGSRARAVYLAALIAIGVGLWIADMPLTRITLVAAAIWWLGVSAWLLFGAAPRTDHGRADGRSARPRWGWLALGLLLLPSLVLGVAALAGPVSNGRGVMLYALCLVWAADIGAFFVGRSVGRHSLAPWISAGKTWEGFGGGLLAVLIYALAGGWILGVPASAFAGWIGLALLAGAVSVTGDLFESMLKREAGVKDSGNLLPGHGGVLDRVDSLVGAIPILALGLSGLGLVGGP